jgi:hypothetical protein
VAAPLQGGGQLGDVDADAADGDRVKGFPRKECDSHGAVLLAVEPG